MLLVHLGTPAEGDAFFARRWPVASAVADPEKELFAAFGLGRASMGQVLGPSVWGAGLRAVLKGHGVGRPIGDPLQLAGDFLVHAGELRWAHTHANSADLADLDEVRRAVRELVTDPG